LPVLTYNLVFSDLLALQAEIVEGKALDLSPHGMNRHWMGRLTRIKGPPSSLTAVRIETGRKEGKVGGHHPPLRHGCHVG